MGDLNTTKMVGNSSQLPERGEKSLTVELGAGPQKITPPTREQVHQIMCANLKTNASMGKSLVALWMQLDTERWIGYHPEQVVNVAAVMGKVDKI